MKRREFIRLASLVGWGIAVPASTVFAGAKPHVVIVGGGVGGATTAKYLRLMDPGVRITVVEINPTYIRPYGSSEVISGHVTMADLEVKYDTLMSKYGIEFVFDEAIGFDPDRQTLNLKQKGTLGYDRLVVAPGIELQHESVKGYSAKIAADRLPCAWIPGAETQLLRDQLKSMPQGGTFLIVAPPNPYRCPPGPYERGALVAEWCQKHNPKAKVLIVDPKDNFVTDQSMMLGWNRLYGYNIPPEFMKGMPPDVKQHSAPGMIDWVPAKQGGTVVKLDAKQRLVETVGGKIKADVINVIPPMRAGRLAQRMGLTNETGFCPINPMSFESRLHPKVHVIGDSSIADMMPKSGFSANTQAKVAARAILDLLAGHSPGMPSWANTCYALAGSHYGLFVADVYSLKAGKITRNPGPRYQPLDATPVQIRLGAVYQQNWLQSFTEDCFA